MIIECSDGGLVNCGAAILHVNERSERHDFD